MRYTVRWSVMVEVSTVVEVDAAEIGNDVDDWELEDRAIGKAAPLVQEYLDTVYGHGQVRADHGGLDGLEAEVEPDEDSPASLPE